MIRIINDNGLILHSLGVYIAGPPTQSSFETREQIKTHIYGIWCGPKIEQ